MSQPKETCPRTLSLALCRQRGKKPGHGYEAADAHFGDLRRLWIFFRPESPKDNRAGKTTDGRIESSVISHVVGIFFPKKDEVRHASPPRRDKH